MRNYALSVSIPSQPSVYQSPHLIFRPMLWPVMVSIMLLKDLPKSKAFIAYLPFVAYNRITRDSLTVNLRISSSMWKVVSFLIVITSKSLKLCRKKIIELVSEHVFALYVLRGVNEVISFLFLDFHYLFISLVESCNLQLTSLAVVMLSDLSWPKQELG